MLYGQTKDGHPSKWGILENWTLALRLNSQTKHDGQLDLEFACYHFFGSLSLLWVEMWFPEAALPMRV